MARHSNDSIAELLTLDHRS